MLSDGWNEHVKMATATLVMLRWGCCYWRSITPDLNEAVPQERLQMDANSVFLKDLEMTSNYIIPKTITRSKKLRTKMFGVLFDVYFMRF